MYDLDPQPDKSHNDCLAELLSLAQCLESRRQPRAAREIYRQVLLELIPDELPVNQSTINLVQELADIFQSRGQYRLAQALHKKIRNMSLLNRSSIATGCPRAAIARLGKPAVGN